MNDIDYQQIIKWVLIVILAGFLGQFGKSFATYLIERARKKKISDASESSGVPFKQPGESTSPVTMAETTGTEAKAKKKALKSLIKLKKRGE
jgi:hypothetical protein